MSRVLSDLPLRPVDTPADTGFVEQSAARALDIGMGRVPLADAAAGVRMELIALRIRCSGWRHYFRRGELDRVIERLDAFEETAGRVT